MLVKKLSTCCLGLTNFTAKFQCQKNDQSVRASPDPQMVKIASLRFVQTEGVNIVILTLVVCGDSINILL